MQIIISNKFEKQFAKLPKKIKRQTIERINIFRTDVFAEILSNHPLSGEWYGYRSINVAGDYRAVFKELEDDTYYFVAVGTHSQLYK